jgi:biopolymer transport protein ExbB
MHLKTKFILAIVALLYAGNSFAWWNDDWSFRKKLTIDTTAATGVNIQESPTEVPVLVRLHTANFGYFLDVQQDGSDLRFIGSDDKTPLKFHIEKFDSINEMALIWVLVPRMVGSTNTEFLWMYYGNASATNGQDPQGTYGVNQALVYHFDEAGTAPKDKTAYKNDATLFTAEAIPAGLIGGGVQFKQGSAIRVAGSPSLQVNPQTGWTASMWVKMTEEQQDAYLLHVSDNAHNLTLAVTGANLAASYSGPETNAATAPYPLTVNEWQRITLIVKNDGLTLLVNGSQVGNAPVSLPAFEGNIILGAADNEGGHQYVGALDEFTVAKIARPLPWLTATIASQSMDTPLLKYGEDETAQSSGGGSYFTVILNNVTIDGWVVIVMLVVMAAISWVVMAAKGYVIAQVRKDNRKFLEQFRKLDVQETGKLDANETEEDKELAASPLTQALFGKHDHFQNSTIYHLYHIGVQQLNLRLGKAVGADAAGLSSSSIEAIRASIDADLVRQNQKLNSQMVMLTIAISGGPFLGLLGTVVGVMITFAAIAATGDVNINAIAPGIAAALVATVAGLAVAIPALFGYNYLASRIKEISSDMHVFVDEFVTRLAELHGR